MADCRGLATTQEAQSPALHPMLMSWQAGKSYYETVVEEALVFLSSSLPLCSDRRYNRSTWFSGRLRYDFVLGISLPSTSLSPYLIEVHGEQHYNPYYWGGNDAKKKQLAIDYDSPLLVIPYKAAYRVSDELLEMLTSFVHQPKS